MNCEYLGKVCLIKSYGYLRIVNRCLCDTGFYVIVGLRSSFRNVSNNVFDKTENTGMTVGTNKYVPNDNQRIHPDISCAGYIYYK